MTENNPGVVDVDEKGHKVRLSRNQRLLRFVVSLIDPRSYLHGLRVLNYYKALHVIPRSKMRKGKGLHISPTVTFSHGNLIELGDRVHLNTRCSLWAGPTRGRIVIGDDGLFGPEVFIITANYRFNDGSPVTQQAMNEADVIIGRDVWVGAKCMILPGTVVGDGAIIGAASVVRGKIPAMAIIAGNPAKIVGRRKDGSNTATAEPLRLTETANSAVLALMQRELGDLDDTQLMASFETSGIDKLSIVKLRFAIEDAAGQQIPDREWPDSMKFVDIAHLPCLGAMKMDALALGGAKLPN